MDEPDTGADAPATHAAPDASAPPEPAPPRPPGPHPVTCLLTACGLALALVATLEFVGIVAQGVAIRQANLGPLYRLGYAFLTNLDTVPLGLILLVAVVLVVLPTLSGQATDDRQDRQAAFALGLAASFALLIVIATVLAVAARLRVDHLRAAPISALTQRVLASYVVRNLGTAAVALAAAVVGLRTRFQPAADAATNPDPVAPLP